MATSKMPPGHHPHIRGDAVMLAPGDYGRATKPDRTQQW